jgi:hypothetical protein
MLVTGYQTGGVSASDGQNAPFRVYAAASTDKVLRDQQLPAQEQPQLALEAARNEFEGAQLIVTAGDQPLRKLQVSISDLKQEEGPAKISSSMIELYKEHYIQVTKPTTTAYPAGWYPDALLPIGDKLEVEAGSNQGIYLKIHVPKGQPAGTYKGEITLHETGNSIRVPVTLQVWDFELTDESHTETAFTLWSGYIAEAHHVTGDAAWDMVDKYYWESVEHRLTPSYLPIPVETPEQYVEQAIPYLTNPKVSAVRLPFFRNDDGTYDEEKMKRIVDMLRERGLLGKTYYYISEIDEPAEAKYPRVKEIADMLDRIAPDVRHFVTTQPVDQLTDSVHNWVALINKYDEPFAQQLQAGGDHVWWYTSVNPKHPFPSYHIDDDLLGSRLLSWEQKDYNVEGTLFWATTIFKKYDGKQYVDRDVWKDPMAFPGANGDGFLFYPGYEVGIDGPVNTLRIENLREGAEDYEYLWQLEQRLKAKAAELGIADFDVHAALQPYYDRLYVNMRDYNQDAANLMQVRHDVAAAIVSVDQGLPVLTGVKAVGDDQREITVYTEPGSTVTIADAAAAEQPGKPGQYVSTLTLTPGLHEVVVEVAHNGTVKRDVVKLQLPDVYPYEVPLLDGEKATDLNRWTKTNVVLSQSTEHVTQGAYSLKAEYKANVNFPNVRLFGAGTGFRSADWSSFGTLEFDVTNPDPERTAIFYVKFHQTNGKTDDTFFESVPAGESRTIRIPLREVSLDLTQMKGIELWMFRQAQPFTLYFDHFRFTAKSPGTMEP